MKTLKNYYVIGGQRERICYGGAVSLSGAQRLAARCRERWDDWRGWRIPRIFAAGDTEIVFTLDGAAIRMPRPGAEPID